MVVPEAPGWRPGVRLCIDWGKARIGVAACDRDGLLAYPVETVPNNAAALHRLGELAAQYEPLEIVLGMPTDLRGRQGVAATTMLDVAGRIGTALGLNVRLVDERLTTASAARSLALTGHGSRSRRSIIDQAAAVAILEQAIEIEKRTGRPAGNLNSAGRQGV
ncbi:putative holliday junction resolvase [Propionibacterium cyclohexanicum]|uniref:Putative pre-16S rRNA nuclease n=1 Tax=Propionibacterium cyclohexanicum TaxID=64702 RepID=A0A1H9Q297_9ACTN|nr:putative holliday junction resolvase [Propionibacterium cyclohexanicum]